MEMKGWTGGLAQSICGNAGVITSRLPLYLADNQRLVGQNNVAVLSIPTITQKFTLCRKKTLKNK